MVWPAVRIVLVLVPLAVWMVMRIPTDGTAVAGDRTDGQDVFVQNCAACHVNGVALAPRIDVPTDWDWRLAFGRDELLVSVLKGKGGMPPKGGNASLSDAQATAGLDFMLQRLNQQNRNTRVAKGR